MHLFLRIMIKVIFIIVFLVCRLVNKHLLFDDETDSQRSTLSARSRSPGLHLARRSPEVAVSALPPGFLEGQMETGKDMHGFLSLLT